MVNAMRWRPEWPAAAVACLAWVLLALGFGAHGTSPIGHEHHLHVHGSVLDDLPGWSLMTVAMMLPLTLPAVRHVGLNSVRARRRRAMALYAATYVAVWAAFGLVAIAGYRVVRATLALDERALLFLALAVAAAWQLTRAKRRAVLACRRTVSLPPVGLRATLGCMRFAVAQAWRCVRSCWAVMVVMVVAGHAQLAWMAALTILVVTEELTRRGRAHLERFTFAYIAAAALVTLGV